MTENAVYEYLRTENRPYNANDVSTNMGQEFAKSTVQKALDSLARKKKIFEKTYGKQKIYCIVQDSTQDPHELTRIQRELDRHATEILAKRSEVERELRTKEAELCALESMGSIDEVRKENERLVSSIAKLESKLKILKKDSGDVDLTKVKTDTQKALDKYSRECRKRKRLCLDVIEAILEGYPGTKKQLYEEIGIEIPNV